VNATVGLQAERTNKTTRLLGIYAKAVFTTTIQLRFSYDSTAIRPSYDHSTSYVTTGLLHLGLNKQAVRVATQHAPPLSSPRRAPPSRRNVAVLSHAEYVPTLTAAAALRVKASLSKAAW